MLNQLFILFWLQLSFLLCYPLKTSWPLKIKANLFAKKEWSPPEDVDSSSPITYTVSLPRGAGITWGTDLSFRWVYVMDLDPRGKAKEKGVKKGDYIIGCGDQDANLIAQDFDFVITSLSKQSTVDAFNHTFYRGKREDLIGVDSLDPSDVTCKVKVIQEGKPAVTLECPGGTNLRKLLVSNGINVYRSITRWTNCSGKQRCGTCIVDLQKGSEQCSRRALDEEMVLAENPDNYRLSCVTSVYGDITVKVQGPVTAAQWTR